MAYYNCPTPLPTPSDAATNGNDGEATRLEHGLKQAPQPSFVPNFAFVPHNSKHGLYHHSGLIVMSLCKKNIRSKTWKCTEKWCWNSDPEHSFSPLLSRAALYFFWALVIQNLSLLILSFHIKTSCSSFSSSCAKLDIWPLTINNSEENKG